MDRVERFKKVLAIFRKMHQRNPDNTYSDKRVLQTSTYISQMLGVDIGYDFGFYVVGVYSPELSLDYNRWFEINKIKCGDSDEQEKKRRSNIVKN